MTPFRTHIILAILVSLFFVSNMYTTNAHILHKNISWEFIAFITSVTIIHIFWIRFWEFSNLAIAYFGVYTLVGGMLSVTLLNGVVLYLADGVSLYRFLLTFMVMGLIGLFIVLFDKKSIIIQCFLTIMIATNTWQYVKKMYWDYGKIAQAVTEEYQKLTVQYKFTNKHNVYYLIPDTYPSFHKLQQQDTFKNRDMYDFLVKNNFSIQENAFSNWSFTLSSMGATFNMHSPKFSVQDDRKHLKQIAAYSYANGKNIVVKTFIENDYNVYYRSTLPDIDEAKDRQVHGNLDAFWVLRVMSQIDPVWNKMHGLLGIKKEISPPHFYTRLQKIPNNNNPKFIYLHSDAVHKDTNECFDTNDKDWNSIQTYYEQIECANKDIKLAVGLIQKADPNAIIIFQADHGLSSYDKTLKALEYDAILREYGILFAVKWPDECAYLGQERYTPVNLFPRVFACLSGTKPNYQAMQPDITYKFFGTPAKQYKVIEDFQYINNIPK